MCGRPFRPRISAMSDIGLKPYALCGRAFSPWEASQSFVPFGLKALSCEAQAFRPVNRRESRWRPERSPAAFESDIHVVFVRG